MKNAVSVLKILKKHGYQSFIVGGSVRDILLGLKYNDIDITTSATPEEVMKLFKTYLTGLKFGSVTIDFKGEKFEVTTFRQDFNYLDSRRPESIKYSTSPQVDAQRRDFTINALMFDENLKLYDFVNGKNDLENKIIRAVGDPDIRFKEDALRILRAFYFQAKLGFSIEEKTLSAINKNSSNLNNIAKERITQEFTKMSRQDNLLLALHTLLNSEVINTLSPLKNGIDFIVSNNLNIKKFDFFIILYILNSNIEKYLIFSNKEKKILDIYKELLANTPIINELLLYNYGLEIVLKYNYLLNIFKKNSFLNNTDIKSLYDSMVIYNRNDLLITNKEIISIINKKEGPWIKDIETRIIKQVLLKNIKNNKQDLIKLVGDIKEEYL